MLNPFDELEPDPRAVAAARALMLRLPPLSEGKMFGVLVVAGAEPLAAFSGDSPLTGFVPHIYDAAARARIEPGAVAAVRALDTPALAPVRRVVSQLAMRRIHDTYVLRNALGETTPLRALFEDGEPPWGAGECAAVKLLQYAILRRLEPLALAEFWWGPPPEGGARLHGTFYPACRTKCGPVLPFLFRGLDVAPRRAWRSSPGPLQLLHEDEHLAVFTKPAGLLSVPGKEESMSAQQLVRERHPHAHLPHRLDLDTSGVLLAALDETTYKALQAQWHTVEKRYIAWLEGEVRDERGSICLPLRVDLEQRPRQMVDPRHGKHALTDYQVLERKGGRTRVAFFPRTGRTHQLRVHAAQGLKAPIVGDRLYGREGERLMLHAEALTFTHPASGSRLRFEAPAPF